MSNPMYTVCVLLLIAMCSPIRADDGDATFRWTATWDAEQGGNNLELVTTVMDGYVDQIKVDGAAAIRTQGKFLYFRVPNDYLHAVRMDLSLAIEVYDATPGVLHVTYDAIVDNSRVSYRDGPGRFNATGSRQWRRFVFDMPSAFLADGTNDDSDFRLAFVDGVKLPIRRLELSVKGLEGQTYETAEAMQQARRALKLSRANERVRRFLDDGAERQERVIETLDKAAEPVRHMLRPLLDGGLEAMGRLAEGTEPEDGFQEEGALNTFIDERERLIQIADNALRIVDERMKLARFIEQFGKGKKDWLFFTRSATDNFEVVVPWTRPAAAETNAPIRLQLCRGEYEPHNIGLFARTRARHVTVTPSDLVAPGGARIPARRVDIRIAQYWYQAGRSNETREPRQLIPELLLHDESIVQTDLLLRENVLNIEGAIDDPACLQPFDLEPCYTKLLWLTIHAPADAASGIYRGAITIACENLPDLKVPLHVQVLPFDLAPNPKIASMYYYNRGPAEPGPALEKYRRRLINMRDHGLKDPMIGLGSDEDNERELALRQEIGLNQGPLMASGRYSVGSFMGDEAPLEQKKAKLRATVDYLWDLAHRHGYNGAYMYAIDEAAGDTLRAEIPGFRLLEEWGRTGAMAAVLSDFPEVALRDMQMPNYAGFPPKHVVDAVHDAGHKIIRYAAPQGGAEDFWLWRYHYGLTLWELDLDGGCTWTYRVSMGSPWNDFDGAGTYRDFMMTYPGVDGPIDTVQWEGYREANDDLRYMATLEQALAKTREAGRHADVVAEVDAWFTNKHERPFNGENLDAVRERIVQYILRLMD